MNKILDPYLVQKIHGYGILRFVCLIMFIVFVGLLLSLICSIVENLEDSPKEILRFMIKISIIMGLIALLFLIGIITIPSKEALVYRQITKLKMLETPTAYEEIENLKEYFDMGAEE